jgi:predicted RNA binding protein YcfA (HicA-like mRNA interferase family)
MSKRKKRLEKLRQNPKTVRLKELDSILRDFGFSPDFTAGSHTTYRHEHGLRVTVAVHGQHIAAYIVKQAIAAIDSILETDDDIDD